MKSWAATIAVSAAIGGLLVYAPTVLLGTVGAAAFAATVRDRGVRR